MTEVEARRQAKVKFGSVDSAKEAVRGQWTVGFLESTRRDLIYAFRVMGKNRGFALTAILSLATFALLSRTRG